MLSINRHHPLAAFDNALRDFSRTRGLGQRNLLSCLSDSDYWVPKTDVSEEDNRYVVSAELPAMKKEDIAVSVKDGDLLLEGERQFKKEEGEGTRYHRVERSYGSFYRRFRLPGDADASQIKADYKDGVLNVSIDKIKEQHDSGRIAVA